MTAAVGERVRIRYSVSGKVRYLSHRDVARVTERAIRRAGIPIAYTEGYSPRPKVQYGLALSTGYESTGEYVDIFLDPQRGGIVDPAVGVDPELFVAALDACMPRGLDVLAAGVIDRSEPSLQDSVDSTSWEVLVAAADPVAPGLRDAVAALMASSTHEIEIVRKGKPVREDLRPLVFDLSVDTPDLDHADARGHSAVPVALVLGVELGTKPRSIRPAELLGALGVSEPARVKRTHQWTNRDGQRGEPLGLDVPSQRTELCAT
ncbi:MAG: TIGR03936 family radical SAM-associated protein [Microthrixaceae bacterium]